VALSKQSLGLAVLLSSTSAKCSSELMTDRTDFQPKSDEDGKIQQFKLTFFAKTVG